MSLNTKSMATLEEHMIPDGFKNLILDLSNDLYDTFPEFEDLFKSKGCNVHHFAESKEASCPKRMLKEYKHCCDTYREYFFDILYENETLFESPNPLYFLLNVDFKALWTVSDISDQTRKTLWKYIQLILFKVVENTNDSCDFKNSAAFFEAIDDEALKTKMTETLEDIKNVFSNLERNEDGDEGDSHHFSEETLPDADSIHEHLSGIFKGKIGRLAEEIMEETREEWSKDFGIDFDEDDEDDDGQSKQGGERKPKKINSINDVFSRLLKDPLKLVNLIKKIGSKLEDKIKSGEVKESELLEETSEMMKNLKNAPGLKDMEKIFKTFSDTTGGKSDATTQGMANMMSMLGGKNSAKKMKSFQSEMDKNIRMSKQRERMLRRLEEKKKRDLETQQQTK